MHQESGVRNQELGERHVTQDVIRVSRGNASVKRLPSPTVLVTVIEPPSCSTIFFEMASPRPESAALGRDEVLEDRLDAIGGNATAGVAHVHLHVTLVTIDFDPDASAGRRRLQRVQHQIAQHAAEREEIALDVDGPDGAPPAATPTPATEPCACMRSTTSSISLTASTGNFSSGIGRARLRRSSNVRWIVENSRLTSLAKVDAVLRIVMHLQHELAVVVDVLDGVRQVVDETRCDATEHRLALLADRGLLQLAELVGHRVEGVAQQPELVVSGDVDALVEAALADGAMPSSRSEIGRSSDRPNAMPMAMLASSASVTKSSS